MSVLDTYVPEANQFYFGKYLGKKLNNDFIEKPKEFRYEIVNPKDKRYYHLVQNLITSDHSIVIKTSWNLDFKPQATIMLADGEKMLITNMKDYEEDYEPQANMLLKDAHKVIYMELT